MRVQYKKSGIRRNLDYAICTVAILFLPNAARAWESGNCFDFAHPIQSISSKIANKNDGFASGDLGKPEGGGGYQLYWAAGVGRANRSLPELLKDLLGHEPTKSSRADEMKIDSFSDQNFFARQNVRFGLHPFPFIHIEWTEAWGFALLAGGKQNPEKVLVTYQKESGTGYIQRLCGQFELSRLPDPNNKSTLIRIYEEAAAKGRTEQDTLSGTTTTLRKLQATQAR